MKCKKCGQENIIKYGLRRGKTCYLCKECGHQFTMVTSKYNNYDKYIAIILYDNYTYYKRKNKFIETELRLSHIAQILDIKYSTVVYWVSGGRNTIVNNKPDNLLNYLIKRKNGKDIFGLLYPDRVSFLPSKKLLKIVNPKKYNGE